MEAEVKGEGDGRRLVPSVQALVGKLLATREAPARDQTQRPGLDFGKFRQKVRGTLRYMQQLDDKALTAFTRILDNEAGADMVDELEALRDQIDVMLAVLGAEEEAFRE